MLRLRIGFFGIGIVLGYQALADNSQVPLLKKAVVANLSPKGQKVFSSQLHEFLTENGYAIDEVVLPEMSYETKKPLTVADFPIELQEPISKIKNIFEEWFVGFEWNDPQPNIKAGPFVITHSGLKLDMRVLNSPNPKTLRLNLDVQVQRIFFKAEKIRVHDVKNDFLGIMGVNNYVFKSSTNSIPFKANVVLTANADNGVLNWSLESIKSNLKNLSLEAVFDRPLILPEVEVRIGSRTHLLNNKVLEQKLIEAHPKLIEKAKEFASNYIEGDLIKKIAEMPPKPIVLDSVSEVNTFAPPGAPVNSPVADDYRWKLVPSSIMSLDTHLRFEFGVNVWDPKSKVPLPLNIQTTAIESPRLKADDAQFDLSLMVNRGFVNRIVALSFARKYFFEYELEKGEMISFRNSPTVTVPSGVGPREVELNIDFDAHLSGLQKFFVGKPAVHIKAPVRARFVKRKDGAGFELHLVAFDMSRVWINPQGINRIFLKNVEKTVTNTFTKLNKDWETKPAILLDKMPVPDSLLGLKLLLKDIKTDSLGFVYFQVDFELPQNRRDP